MVVNFYTATPSLSHSQKITIRGRISPKGEGDDAEHPSLIPMDSTTTRQAPRGPMTRARARTVKTEVNSFLSEFRPDSLENGILPQRDALCILRYFGDRHEEAHMNHQVHRRPEKKEKEEGRVRSTKQRRSRTTPALPYSRRSPWLPRVPGYSGPWCLLPLEHCVGFPLKRKW